MTASSLAFPAADENIDAPPSGGSTAELSHEAPPGVQALSPEALARAQALSLQALAGAQSTERVSVAATRASRFVEFMAVGGATLFLFPIAWAARAVVGLDHADYAFGFLTFYGAYLINDPHFSVTYLLFYRDARRRALRSQYDWGYRVRYIVAGLVVPAALLLWAIASLRSHSAQSLGWMVQLMYLLVGWHYVKQGFGALMVLSARRGTRFNSMERIVILTHCFAGWAYAWAIRAAAGGEFEEKGVVYTALVHPHWLALAAGIVLGTSSIALVVVLAMKWRRARLEVRGAEFPVGPLCIFLVTVWLWTIYSGVDPLVRYAIPALHSIQYGYFVALMKRNQARAEEQPPHFGRPAAARLAALSLGAVALGWLFFHGAPAILDGALIPHRRGVAPDALGPTPYFAAIFVIVNIHHYFMDAVIWRRDHPETRYLRASFADRG